MLALGSEVMRPDIPGLAEHAFDVDTYAAARRLEDHLTSLGRSAPSPGRSTIVVVGAGFALNASGMPINIQAWPRLFEGLSGGLIVAVVVIPFVGNLSDKIGRRPPMIIGALVSGLMSFGYLYAISIHNVPMAIAMSLIMWGVVYQGYNAVYPSYYPELFPTRARVSGMAIAQNIGTMLTALLPAL